MVDNGPSVVSSSDNHIVTSRIEKLNPVFFTTTESSIVATATCKIWRAVRPATHERIKGEGL